MRPARLAQFGVVTVLAMSLCGTMAATANAHGGEGLTLGVSHTARAAAEVAAARDGAVGVAADAIAVAHAVQAEGSEAAVDAAQLAALEAATSKLNDLVASVDPTVAAAVAASVAAAPAVTAPVVPADVTPAAAPVVPAAPTEARLPVDEPAPVATAAPVATPAPTPSATTIPVIPPTDGREDEATAKLRDAVAAVAVLTADVRDKAEANRVAAAAAAQAEADAAAQAAAAAAAQAQADAAAQAAAEAAAAQRAAWKQSLQGYSNGKIPDSALCGVSFDGSVRLRCDAAEQLDILNTAYREHFGTDLTISDSYRSYSGQVSCVRTKGYLCATPGTSNHGNGIAIDFGGGVETFGTKQHAWMVANAPDLQWVHPSWAAARGSKPEAWHWEYSG